jgi:methionine synthase II (cobalamin-independent)
VLREISSLSAIHVCGTVTPMVRTVLLASKADIVDHEFAGSPSNIQAYSTEDLEGSGKFLAYGCVSSTSLRVESVKEIFASLHNALEMFGQRIMAKPDCGFAGMQSTGKAYEVVLQKLRNMTEAARKLAATDLSNMDA